MDMTEKEAKRKLKAAFNRGNFNISLAPKDRKKKLIELLMFTGEEHISRAVFKAIRYYLKDRPKPLREKATEKLTELGYPEENLRDLSNDTIRELYEGSISVQGEEE